MRDEAERIREILAEHRSLVSSRWPGALLRTLEGFSRVYEWLRRDHHGRCLFELLQNANDACAGLGTRGGTVWFVVTDSAVIVADNGSGFGEESVAAILAAGHTTKSGDSDTIGHKGVGFVSVYELTDTPQILTHHGVDFGFDRRRAQELNLAPSFLVSELEPVDLEPDLGLINELRDEGAKTIIRLPRRPGEGDPGAVRREGFQISALLFMPMVGRLIARRTGASALTMEWTCLESERSHGVGTVVTLSNGADHLEWLMVRSVVQPDEETLDAGGLAGIDELEVGIGIPWENGRPAVGGPVSQIHCYYPTDESAGSALVVHGDFATTVTRKQIDSDSAVTRLLADRVVELAADTVRSVASEDMESAARLLDVLAPTGEATAGIGRWLAAELSAALAHMEIVPTLGGRLEAAGECSVLPEIFEDGLRPGLIGVLDGSEVIADPEFLTERAVACIERLGGWRMGEAEMAGLVAPTGDSFTEVLGVLRRWVMRMRDGTADAVLKVLRGQPVGLDRTGSWRAPADLHLAAEGSEESSELLELALAAGLDDPYLSDFLRTDLGVSEVGLDDVIDQIRKITSRPPDPSDRVDERDERFVSLLMSYWRNDRETFEATVKERVDALPAPLFSPERTLFPGLGIPVERTGEGVGMAGIGSGVYFPESWSESDLLERLYGHLTGVAFLRAPAPESVEAREAERSFYRLLGVSSEPFQHRRTNRPKYWPEFYRSLASRVERDCGRGHPRSGLSLELNLFDRIEELVEEPTVASSEALLEVMAEGWLRRGDPLDRVRCNHRSHRGRWAVADKTGYQEWLLNGRRWVPHEGEFLRPINFWQMRQGSQMELPRARKPLNSTRGIVIARMEAPKVDALVVALRWLKNSSGDLTSKVEWTADQVAQLFWAQDELDYRSFSRSDGSGLSPFDPERGFPLLAHRRGQREWVGCDEELVIWDLPGYPDVSEAIDRPVVLPEAGLDTATMRIALPAAKRASTVFRTKPIFDGRVDDDPWLREDQIAALVAAVSEPIRREVASWILSWQWLHGAGLHLVIEQEGVRLAETGPIGAFFLEDDALHEADAPGRGSEPNPRHRKRRTMHINSGFESMARGEAVVDELLRSVPEEWRKECQVILQSLTTSSPERWRRLLEITEEDLVAAAELIDDISEVVRNEMEGEGETSSEPLGTDDDPAPDLRRGHEETTHTTIQTNGADAELVGDPTPGRGAESGSARSADQGNGHPSTVDSRQDEMPASPASRHHVTGSTEGGPAEAGSTHPDRPSDDEAAQSAETRLPPIRSVPEGTEGVRVERGQMPPHPDRRSTGSQPSSPQNTPGRDDGQPEPGDQDDELPRSRRMELEEKSIPTVMNHLRKHWEVKDEIDDVRKLNLGWDLQFVDEDGTEWLVEAKSTSGKETSFDLTPNELDKLGEHADRYLVVFVSNMTGDHHKVWVIKDLHEAVEEIRPVSYRVTKDVWMHYLDSDPYVYSTEPPDER